MTAGVIVIAGAGAAKFGLGTYCSVCPVGFLQVAAAARSIPVDMLAGVIIGLLAVLVLGRFFCGWLCTTQLVRKMFKPKNGSGHKASAPDKRLLNLPFAMLLLAVGISFILRFPVFCLICPIGLFFGFVFAMFKLFFSLEPSWNLVIFPAVIALEVLIFRRWCSYICPISAVFTLVSKIPFIKTRPVMDGRTCTSALGGTCLSCHEHCPEHIDVTNDKKAMNEQCTSCMECADQCPTDSIHWMALGLKKETKDSK